ncbi:large conductance mechanosensitive channel protein MscL [Catenuloplanes atrovinosus]|uniref:Large-conductance mechanosensitive channel n=1 Tax=Catenuloplanes atrovinosus TaxID=137266 RepID=A0AAE3YW41_9ACTN|nr:large conductance mechanosensitive channel protein MscL [Catenuloplanes atrovinosus]MDR7279782.1 large conductance mechanosensitive channel [Catenuloplanes atrovinosus]
MIKGFKDFIMRGNVIELAVGVVIGTAFTALVTSFTKSFLEPLIKLATGGTGELKGAWSPTAGISFEYAAFINQVITFLMTAAVVYFLVVYPMNKLAERRKRGEEPEPDAPSDEVRLLTEIRDALIAGNSDPDRRAAIDEAIRREHFPPRG